MTITTAPTVLQTRELLRRALTGALAADARTLPGPLLADPSPHRRALFAETSVVTGAPGEGKSLLCRILTDPALRAAAAREYRMPRLEHTRATVVFSADPTAGVLDQVTVAGLTSLGVRPADLWTTAALTALGAPEMTAAGNWAARCAWTADTPGALQRSAAALAGEPGESTDQLLLFDGLDRLHPDRDITDRHLRAILDVTRSLTEASTGRRSRVLARVFVRPDLLAGAATEAPGSRRRPLTATDLSWTPDALHHTANRWTELYGLLFHLMGNQDGPDAEAFRCAYPGWTRKEDGRYTAPDALRRQPAAQRQAFAALAGVHMDDNPRRGTVFDWLPTRLMDGHGRVAPRTFLAALAAALEHTEHDHADHPHALHHQAVLRGAVDGATARAAELGRSTPWVIAALGALTGWQVPLAQDRVHALWEQARLAEHLPAPAPGAPTGPRDPNHHPGLVEELIAAGVMTRRSDGRLDLPDLHRIPHGLGRHGGVRRTA